MSLADLERDMRAIPPRAIRDLTGIVRDGIRAGADEARALATRTAGSHGKHYPKSITSEMNRGRGLFGNSISGEYGPDVNKLQGGMTGFETGSRNQPPHLDLAKSADLIGPIFGHEVHNATGDWFWGGAR